VLALTYDGTGDQTFGESGGDWDGNDVDSGNAFRDVPKRALHEWL
jgi:hypothetical protein